MDAQPALDRIYVPSANVVTREIDGHLALVPLEPSGDRGKVLVLNETGLFIWEAVAARKPIGQVVEEMSATFEAPAEEIAHDALEFVRELLRRGLVEPAGEP